MHDSTYIPQGLFYYVNLLQEESQQCFYNIHQNRGGGGGVLEWFLMYWWLRGSEVRIQLDLSFELSYFQRLTKIILNTWKVCVLRNRISGCTQKIKILALREKNRKSSLQSITAGRALFNWKLSEWIAKPGDAGPPSELFCALTKQLHALWHGHQRIAAPV